MEETKDFDAIFRKYYDALYIFARQFLDEDESHDVVTAAFEDVWVNFANIQKETVRSYLYKDVRNKCLDILRHSKYEQAYVSYLENLTQEYNNVEEHIEELERAKAIQRAISLLKSPTFEIFTACYVDNLSYKETAEQMGISINTVKKHIKIALKFFRERRLAKESKEKGINN